MPADQSIPWDQPAADQSDPNHAPARARRRAILALAATIAGVLIATHTLATPAPLWFIGAIVLAGAGWLARGRTCAVLLLLAVLAASAGWTNARLSTVDQSSLLTLLPSDANPKPVRVEGIAVRDAELVHPPSAVIAPPYDTGPMLRFELKLVRAHTSAGWSSATGTAIVRIATDDPNAMEIRAGDRFRITGVLRPPGHPLNPGEPDWALRANQRARVGTLFASSPELLEQIEPVGVVQRSMTRLLAQRSAVNRRVVRALVGDAEPSPQRALVLALLLGQREPQSGEVYDSFRHIGAAHLMAISGFHLMILAGVVVLLVRATGEHGPIEPVLVAALILGYMLLLPARAPIIRAGVLVLAVLAGDALGRRYDRTAMLAWVGVALLVWRPLDALSLGYQLSLGMTALLLHIARRSNADPLRSFRSAAPLASSARYVRDLAAVCIACWLVAQPAIAVHTGTITPIAPLASIVMLPLVIVTLIAGYLAAIVGLLAPALSGLTSALVLSLGQRSITLAEWVERVPGAWFETAPPPLWWGAAATIAAVWLVLRMRDWRAWLAAALLTAWLIVGIIRGGPLPNAVRLRVDMLAIGDGSCLLIRSGNEAMLWDCGSLRTGLGDEMIPRAFHALGVSRIESAVVTHANVDHFNALPEVADRFAVARVRTSQRLLGKARGHPAGGESQLLRALDDLGVAVEPIEQGTSFTLGSARIDILWPAASVPADLPDNDASIVALLRVHTDAGERALLLTGDIQDRGIAALLAAVPDLHADVIEAPHHGGYLPSADSFVRTIGPSAVLQSTGRSRLDDPRWGAARARSTWLTTARDGAVFAEIHADGTIRAGPSR